MLLREPVERAVDLQARAYASLADSAHAWIERG